MSGETSGIGNKRFDIYKSITGNDKEMLIEANGNMLRHQAQVKEEDSFFDEPIKKEDNKPFDFRSVFDEKGKFKR